MTRVALVAGGAGALGSAIAATLEGNGWTVARGDVGTARGETGGGPGGLDVPLDVTDEGSVAEAFDRITDAVGPVGALVNSAGITRDRTIHKMSLEEFEDLISVNLVGPFLTTREFVRRLRRDPVEDGRVVNISSVSGEIGNFGQANYAASKAGLVALTKVTAREIATFGATANAVLPGFIESPMTAAMDPTARQARLDEIPLGRPGAPEEVADLVGWLCGKGAGYVTGSAYKIAGGRAL